MKAYTIKSSGATIASNILWEVRHDLKSDDWFHTGIIFFRKKDAKKYLEAGASHVIVTSYLFHNNIQYFKHA